MYNYKFHPEVEKKLGIHLSMVLNQYIKNPMKDLGLT